MPLRTFYDELYFLGPVLRRTPAVAAGTQTLPDRARAPAATRDLLLWRGT